MLKKLIRNKDFFSKKNIKPVPKDAPLLFEIFKKDKEIERLKKGYCELKEKCNNGECDCAREEYLPIAKARIEYVCNLIEEDKKKDKQLSIFDLESKGE